MIAFENTLINSAASVAATKPASTTRIVEKPMPGSPSHSVLSPAKNTRDRAAIQGLRAPRPSAAAPRKGLRIAMKSPATEAA